MTKKAAPKPESVDAVEEVKEHTPTPEEAKQMFADNPGLAYVETTEGGKSRGDV